MGSVQFSTSQEDENLQGDHVQRMKPKMVSMRRMMTMSDVHLICITTRRTSFIQVNGTFRWKADTPSVQTLHMSLTLSVGMTDCVDCLGSAETRGGGVLRFGLDRGVPLKPQNPTHFYGSFWQEKVPIFRDFSWNIGPFVTLFSVIWGILDFCRKWDSFLGISCENVTSWCWSSWCIECTECSISKLQIFCILTTPF